MTGTNERGEVPCQLCSEAAGSPTLLYHAPPACVEPVVEAGVEYASAHFGGQLPRGAYLPPEAGVGFNPHGANLAEIEPDDPRTPRWWRALRWGLRG